MKDLELPVKGNDVGKRLKMLRGDATQAEFAHRLGVSVPTLSRYENAATIPTDVLIKICNLTGARADWLLFGDEPVFEAELDAQLEERAGPQAFRVAEDQLRYVPVLSTAPAGPGEAVTDGGYPAGEGMHGSVWCRDPDDEHAYALIVEGNSMSPELNHGDIVIASPRRADDLRYPISVFRMGDETQPDGETMIKYVKPQKMTWRIESANPAYPPFSVPNSDGKVVARVVERHQRMGG
jgi:phage repressor protein C with HTH and peptisase S24 domain